MPQNKGPYGRTGEPFPNRVRPEMVTDPRDAKEALAAIADGQTHYREAVDMAEAVRARRRLRYAAKVRGRKFKTVIQRQEDGGYRLVFQVVPRGTEEDGNA